MASETVKPERPPSQVDGLAEAHCHNCGKLMAKLRLGEGGVAEIKCRRCGVINRFR